MPTVRAQIDKQGWHDSLGMQNGNADSLRFTTEVMDLGYPGARRETGLPGVKGPWALDPWDLQWEPPKKVQYHI
ncbi:hypothetical protein PCANC_28467 [Puccinia coronata f. sp. avenae]|uniref:Uncharacterized protein n=1 Tax=Puccinia coronata f. sp. avenae TaxID=200324 RepID=A0A2N5S1L4_9BASI|nr:hypothetical protein PCANC_28467 [Puccinia coronata f. sp. avenae]